MHDMYMHYGVWQGPDSADMVECRMMQGRMAMYGVDVKPEALHRALYPPTGDTLYYELGANLPKSFSQG
jgi:hypothetical protein